MGAPDAPQQSPAEGGRDAQFLLSTFSSTTPVAIGDLASVKTFSSGSQSSLQELQRGVATTQSPSLCPPRVGSLRKFGGCCFYVDQTKLTANGVANSRQLGAERCGKPLRATPCAAMMCRSAVQQRPARPVSSEISGKAELVAGAGESHPDFGPAAATANHLKNLGKSERA